MNTQTNKKGRLVKGIALLLIVIGLLLVAQYYQSNDVHSDQVDIKFEKFTLGNGLTLIVHEDDKAPIVAVNVWYHVGSKNEKPGKTGFAHLFEHLMFNGSENYQGDWFVPLEEMGATDLNGTTWFDRTNYFQNVPVGALDRILWLESDRMGHFMGAITQEALDEQRKVVKNEKRQGDNRPYGKSEYVQLAGMYPKGHPYRWSTIGSMADLEAASVDDVKTWFKTYYGAANVVLTIAGDVKAEDVLKRVNHYFGDIEPGPSLPQPKRWVAKRNESSRDILFDEVAQSRITKSWNVPAFGEEQEVYLDLAADVLGSGKNSRLYKRLVYEDQLASEVSVSNQTFEISGMFQIEAMAKPGVPLEKVEAIIDEELARFIENGPTSQELDRVKTSTLSSVIRGLEKVGGFSGKAQLLARYQTYTGDAGNYKAYLSWFENATVKQVKDTAEKWLSTGDHNLEVLPRGDRDLEELSLQDSHLEKLPQENSDIEVLPHSDYKAAKTGADRSQMPKVGKSSKKEFPAIESYKLANGTEVYQVQRGDLPLTRITAQFDAGYAADIGTKLGVSAMMAAMLDEGTEKYSALELSAKAESLGAELSAWATLDTNSVQLSSLSNQLQPSLDLFMQMLSKPLFQQEQLERVRSNWLNSIAQEKTQPVSIALRQLPPILYGEGHPYGVPFTGSGTVESVNSITPVDLAAFHQQWIRPEVAKLIVIGNLSRAEMEPILNKTMGKWRVDAVAANSKNIKPVAALKESTIYLVDKPGAPQSLILGGHLLPSNNDKAYIPTELAIDILGGSFNARMNMNLREDKGWAYGAYTLSRSAIAQRPMFYYAPVQKDKTVAALKEMIREATEFLGSNPATEEELQRTRSGIILSMPGKFETNASVANNIAEQLRFNRPVNYIEQYQAELEQTPLSALHQAAKKTIQPKAIAWLIVGDLSLIEQPLRDANIAKIVVLEK